MECENRVLLLEAQVRQLLDDNETTSNAVAKTAKMLQDANKEILRHTDEIARLKEALDARAGIGGNGARK